MSPRCLDPCHRIRIPSWRYLAHPIPDVLDHLGKLLFIAGHVEHHEADIIEGNYKYTGTIAHVYFIDPSGPTTDIRVFHRCAYLPRCAVLGWGDYALASGGCMDICKSLRASPSDDNGLTCVARHRIVGFRPSASPIPSLPPLFFLIRLYRPSLIDKGNSLPLDPFNPEIDITDQYLLVSRSTFLCKSPRSIPMPMGNTPIYSCYYSYRYSGR